MKLMVIDGNSLVNRAFYGVRPLSAADGTPTNAVYGFLNMFFKLREELQPDEICVCFDRKEKTFRHLAYAGYKAQRKPMPEELSQQMPLVKEALDLLGVPRMETPGYEADDLLGTLGHLAAAGAQQCVIVTGDRDSLQFIEPGTQVALVTTRMGQTSTELYDEARFQEKYRGLMPPRIVDLKSIMGDASDNIPGVKGIGEKGAMELLCRFGSLEGVYQQLDDPTITPAMRKKLEEGRDMAEMSYRLAKGVTDAPVPLRPGQLAPAEPDEAGLYRLLNRLELRTLIKRLGLTGAAAAPAAPGAETSAFSVRKARPLSGGDLPGLEARLPGLACVVAADLSCLAVTLPEETVTVTEDDVGETAFAQLLRALLCGKTGPVLHQGKPLVSALMRRGWEPTPPVFDTALGAYLLDPARGGYEMQSAARQVLDADALPPIYDGEDARTLLGISPEALEALAQHSDLCAAMHTEEARRLAEDGMTDLMQTIELPLLPVLARMQAVGMGVDQGRLLEFGQQLSRQLEETEAQVYQLAGERFNIGSPKQLGVVLFEKLGLKTGKKTRTGYSTDADTLDKLKDAHPAVSAILEWRKLSKLKSTYVDGLNKVIEADGRIHSTFHQMVTATGRLSSADPNLQNIPVRREDGSEIRRCFVPQPGWVLVDADYSQIELRILAHVADDAAMQEAFSSGEDIHAVTASQVFHVPLKEVTHQMRSYAKAVNFGIVYGISAWSLSDDIHVSPGEAQDYIHAYLDKYTGVRAYMEQIKLQARQDGYVTTLYGRRRYLPELNSSNHNLRSFGERAALNTPIQGAAADLIKLAMVRVDSRLRREGLRSRLVLQVHDELILESPEDERERACALLKEEMEGAAQLKVRLLTEVSWGENWYDAKK